MALIGRWRMNSNELRVVAGTSSLDAVPESPGALVASEKTIKICCILSKIVKKITFYLA